jgi:hypothetical protein
LLCCLAPDGLSNFLKDRWLPGAWGSYRSAWNGEGYDSPWASIRRIAGSSSTPRAIIWSDPSGSDRKQLRPLRSDFRVASFPGADVSTARPDVAFWPLADQTAYRRLGQLLTERRHSIGSCGGRRSPAAIDLRPFARAHRGTVVCAFDPLRHDDALRCQDAQRQLCAISRHAL